MSFRAAHDHNKAASKDMTSLMPSSTRREDPAATMRRCSFSFAFAYHSFSFAFACHELYCLELSNLFCFQCVINYIVDLLMCMIILVYSACFVGSPSREGDKTSNSKKIKLLYSCQTRAPALGTHIFISVTSLMNIWLNSSIPTNNLI
jgi:hypothetical protein